MHNVCGVGGRSTYLAARAARARVFAAGTHIDGCEVDGCLGGCLGEQLSQQGTCPEHAPCLY